MRASVLTLTTLLALTLTACGGGGGSSDNPNQSPVVVNPPTNGGGGSGGNTTPTPTTDGFVVSGKAIKFENGKQTGTVDSTTRNTGLVHKDWSVVIDGKEIIAPQYEFYVNYGGYFIDKPSGYTAHHGAPGYARFGVLHDPKNNMDYVFYTGKEHITPVNEIPTTKDPVEYVGYAVAYRPSDKKTFATFSNTDPYPVNFKVDFANKKLTGEIAEMEDFTNGEQYKPNVKKERIKDIKLSATIKGNTFSGSKNGVSTEGIFVGPKAAEMTGLFKDDNNKIQGAFGAKKQ